MIRRELSEKTKRILALADGTMTATEIAATLGVTQDAVRKVISRAVAHGDNYGFKKIYDGSSAYTKYSRGDWRCGGGMIELVNSLEPDVQDWLVAQITNGSTMADIIRAIVVDAYNEERG